MVWCRVPDLKDEKRLLQTTEVRMFHMICEKTIREGISNKTIRDMTRNAKIKKKIVVLDEDAFWKPLSKKKENMYF